MAAEDRYEDEDEGEGRSGVEVEERREEKKSRGNE